MSRRHVAALLQSVVIEISRRQSSTKHVHALCSSRHSSHSPCRSQIIVEIRRKLPEKWITDVPAKTKQNNTKKQTKLRTFTDNARGKLLFYERHRHAPEPFLDEIARVDSAGGRHIRHGTDFRSHAEPPRKVHHSFFQSSRLMT